MGQNSFKAVSEQDKWRKRDQIPDALENHR
jgi:hypothetical protein